MSIDLSVLEEEYEKMTNTPVVAVRPPAACSQAQKASSFLSVCPTGLAALDCRPLLNTSVEEIVRSPVALPHGLGSKSWPIAPGYVENKLVPQLPRPAEAEAGLRLAEAGAAPRPACRPFTGVSAAKTITGASVAGLGGWPAAR